MWLFMLFPAMLFTITFLAIFAIAFFGTEDWVLASYEAGNMFFNVIPFVTIGATIWALISIFFGQKMILGFAGAKSIEKKDAPELYRIVENLAIRTGIPTPKIAIIEDQSMNAFATGFSPNNASVAITRGLLEKLNKKEVEAVMAHEMGHILHRDIRIMLIAVTMVGIIQLVAELIFRIVFRNLGAFGKGKGSKKGGGAAILVIIAAAVVIWLISIFGALFVQMGISRKREYMADAESANLTRDPLALASALEKITADSRVEVLDGKRSIAAMCIADPLDQKQSFMEKLSGFFASHPPAKDRIALLRSMGQ